MSTPRCISGALKNGCGGFADKPSAHPPPGSWVEAAEGKRAAASIALRATLSPAATRGEKNGALGCGTSTFDRAFNVSLFR